MELDLRGQIAAANVANERLDLLFRKYGTGTVGDVMVDMLAYAGFLLCKKLSEMPDGEWHTEDYLYHSAIAPPSMRSRPVCAAPRGSGRYRDYGNRATIGRKAAVIDFGWIHLRGLVAWLI